MGTSWKEVLAWSGPKPHVEAVGAVALAYNDLEFSLYGLIGSLLDEDEDVVPFLFFELNNAQRADFLRHVFARTHGAEVCGVVNDALKAIGICAENRNLILHSLPTMGAAGKDKLLVAKGIKGRPGSVNEYAFSVADLRGAALSAHQWSRYVYAVVDTLRDLTTGDWPYAWPERPPQPRKLSLCLRPELPEDDESPPQP